MLSILATAFVLNIYKFCGTSTLFTYYNILHCDTDFQCIIFIRVFFYDFSMLTVMETPHVFT